MGLVYNENSGAIRSYPAETISVTEALVTPGQDSVSLTVADMSEAEVRALLLKLDMMANSYQNEAIAVAIAEAFPVIVDAVRLVKKESKQPFKGIKAMGAALDIIWLRPEMVGGTILNPAATASLGLYGGTIAAVYTWLQSFTAGTSDDIIPEQTMKEEAAVLHLGVVDTMPLFGEVPKVNQIKFTLAGVATPAQPLGLGLLNGSQLAFQRFEMPILVGPEMKQKIELDPYISGYDKPELLTLVIGKGEDLTFT